MESACHPARVETNTHPLAFCRVLVAEGKDGQNTVLQGTQYRVAATKVRVRSRSTSAACTVLTIHPNICFDDRERKE